MLHSIQKRAEFLIRLVEQFSVSGLSFISLAFLGRVLRNREFADFVTVQAALVFPQILAAVIWSNPSLVFASKRFTSCIRSYATCLTVLIAATAFVLSLVILLICHLVIRPLSLDLAAAAILSTIAWSCYDGCRRMSYATQTGERLIHASFALVLIYGTWIGALCWLGKLTATTAFFGLSLGSVVACFISVSRRAGKSEQGEGSTTFSEIASCHWNYARWSIASVPAYYVATQGFLLLGGRLLEDSDLGGLRAAQNIASILTVVVLTVENRLVPQAAIILENENVESLIQFICAVYKKMLAAQVVLLPLFIIVNTFGFYLLYHSKYPGSTKLVPLFTLYQFMLLFSVPAQSAWCAQEKLNVAFLAHSVSAVLACVIGLPMMVRYGAIGGAIGFLISGSTYASITVFLLWRQRRMLFAERNSCLQVSRL